MNGLGRPKVIDKIAFDLKFREAYEEYRNNFLGPTINVMDLVNKHGLRRNNKLINNKQWSAHLVRLGLVSQKKFIKDTIIRTFERLLATGISREQAVKATSHLVNCPSTSINQALWSSGKGLKERQRKETLQVSKRINEKFRNKQKIKEIALAEDIPVSRVLTHLRALGYKDKEIGYVHNAYIQYRDLEKLNLINAHLLGLIWSDGSISNSKDLTIRLNAADQEYLEDIARSLVIAGPSPKVNKIPTKQYSGRFSNKDVAGLSICRRNFVQYLHNQLGLPKNKEQENHGFPECILKAEDDIFFAFLRGFLEGDGHITKNTHHPMIGFSCTAKVANELANQLFKRLKLSVNIVHDRGNTYTARIAGFSPTLLLLKNIYNSYKETPIMKRKFELADKTWSEYSERIFHQVISLRDVLAKINFVELSLLSKGLKHRHQKHLFLNTSSLDVLYTSKKNFSNQTQIPMAYIHRIVNGSRKSTSDWHCLGH